MSNLNPAVLAVIIASMAIQLPVFGASKQSHYRVVYTLKMDGEPESEPLSDPGYALGGKAIVLPIPNKVLVIQNGKCRKMATPKGAKPLQWRPGIVRDGRYLLYRTSAAGVDSLHEMDLSSGASKMLRKLPQPGLMHGVCTPDAKLLALHTSGNPAPTSSDPSHDSSPGDRLYDLSTGKLIAKLQADNGYTRLVAWNKTGDGVFLVRYGSSAQVQLWKPAANDQKIVADLGPFVRCDLVTLSPSADKIFYVNTSDELCVRTAADGKDRLVAVVDELAESLCLSPTGRYMLVTISSTSFVSGFQIVDLSTGKVYTEKYKADLETFVPSAGACAWHPTEDRFLAVYSGKVNVGEMREYDAKKLPLKQVTTARETLEQAVHYYRGMGFFAGDAGLSDSELALKLSNLHQQKFEEPLRQKGKPYGLDDLLVLDDSRVWETETESFYEAQDTAYADAVKKWGVISRGAFRPEDVQETWSDNPESVVITFRSGGKECRIESTGSETWIEIEQLLADLNREMRGSGYQFESTSSISHTRVLALTAAEKKKLERERGWKFDQ